MGDKSQPVAALVRAIYRTGEFDGLVGMADGGNVGAPIAVNQSVRHFAGGDKELPHGNDLGKVRVENQIGFAGETIRALLFGKLVGLLGDEQPAPQLPSVVTIRNCIFTGFTDLSDLEMNSGPDGPSLEFENCCFADGIDLSSARIKRLSMVDCRYPKLVAQGLQATGKVDLSGSQGLAEDTPSAAISSAAAQGADQPGLDAAVTDDAETHEHSDSVPVCQINLCESRIGGSLTVQRASLVAPSPGAGTGPETVALNLMDAKIGASVMMQPGFSARGSVCFNDASIKGSAFLRGASISRPGLKALQFDRLTLDGSLTLSIFKDGEKEDLFRCAGEVSLYNCFIGGELFIHGARLTKAHDGSSLNAFMAKVHQKVRLGDADGHPLIIERKASFASATIGGLSVRTANLGELDLRESVNQSLLEVYSCKVARITAADASIESDVILQDIRARNGALMCDLDGASIGGSVFSTRNQFSHFRGANARIGGDFRCKGAWSPDQECSPGWLNPQGEKRRRQYRSTWMTLNGARIEGVCTLKNTWVSKLHMENADIRLAAEFDNVLFAQSGISLSAGGAKIKGGLTLNALTRGSLAFDFMQVDGLAQIERLELDCVYRKDMQVDLEACRVDGRMQIDDVRRIDPQLQSASRLPLPFIKGGDHKRAEWSLVELVGEHNGKPVALDMIWDGGDRLVAVNSQTNLATLGSDVSVRVSRSTALDYLRFAFFAFFGQDDLFRVLEEEEWKAGQFVSGADDADLFKPKSVEGGFEVEFPCVAYGLAWRGTALITTNGQVEIPQIRSVGVCRGGLRNDGPYRLPQPDGSFRRPVDGTWKALAPARFSKLVSLVETSVSSTLRLTGASTSSFADRAAKAYGGGIRLVLNGFTYHQIVRNELPTPGETAAEPETSLLGRLSKRIDRAGNSPESVPRESFEERKLWLNRQYVDSEKIEPSEFTAQPFEHLARYYKSLGRYQDAAKVTRYRLSLEGKVGERVWSGGQQSRWLGWLGFALASVLVWWFSGQSVSPWPIAAALAAGFIARSTIRHALWIGRTLSSVTFGYGLSGARALTTFVSLLVAGWLVTEIAARDEISVEFAAIDWRWTYALPERPILTMDVLPVESVTLSETSASAARNFDNLPCGNEIVPALYAVDVFIPLLDLRQESQCEPSSEPQLWAWRWAKAFYAILGWVITSLTVLTFAGIARRHIEN